VRKCRRGWRGVGKREGYHVVGRARGRRSGAE
jgi:hypothetical protein